MLSREVTRKNIQVKEDSGIPITDYIPPKPINNMTDKRIVFVPKYEPSFETKEKLDKLMIDKQERIRSKVKVLSNFSHEFIKSDAMINPIVIHSMELLRQGQDVYKVMEFMTNAFIKKDKEQFDLIKQLISGEKINYGNL